MSLDRFDTIHREPPMTGHVARLLLGRTSQVPLPALKRFRLSSNLSAPIRHSVGSPEHCGVIG